MIDDRSADDGPGVVHALMQDDPMPRSGSSNSESTQACSERAISPSRRRDPHLPSCSTRTISSIPRGIAKLRDGLARDPEAAFAYGIIERFNDEGSLGLMGLEGWDERRLARSHYIDAMALVRVDAWREVGGYVTDPALELGWEDYDLWLNFASHGYRGVHVREIIGRYRVHGVSSLAITTLDTDDLMGRLQARHSRFFRAARPESK